MIKEYAAILPQILMHSGDSARVSNDNQYTTISLVTGK